MTFAHELGHIICGCVCGGSLKAADLYPWYLPYSFFEPDPYPLVTLWGGPILGVFLPIVVAACIRNDWAWSVAHFCLLANGLYLVTAWFTGDRYLDTAKLLEHGTHPFWIVVYCAATICFGYSGFRRHCLRILSPLQQPPIIP